MFKAIYIILIYIIVPTLIFAMKQASFLYKHLVMSTWFFIFM